MTEEIILSEKKQNHKFPGLSTDGIIEVVHEGGPGIVLIDRKNPPYGIAIPGGYQEYGISPQDNTIKEVDEETHMKFILNNGGRAWNVYGEPDRDPRNHNITIVYTGKGIGEPRKGSDAKGARSYSRAEALELANNDALAFDHPRFLREYFAEKEFTAGIIGRFQPLHIGTAAVLETLCQKWDKVIIGIGSANREGMHYPFSAGERMEFIEETLKDYDNYEIRFVNDYGHLGKESGNDLWKEEVKKAFSGTDFFFTGNGYVKELLKDDFAIASPYDVIEQIRVHGSDIRLGMAHGDNSWHPLVPKNTIPLLERLVGRFQEQYGAETIAEHRQGNYWKREDVASEKEFVERGRR